MILTTHSLVGAAAANLFPSDPALGFAASWASHYLLDSIPHRDYDISGFFDEDTRSFRGIFSSARSALTMLLIFGDFAFGIGLALLLFARNRETLFITLLGIAGGVLPDLLQFLYSKWKRQPMALFQKIHDAFHHEDKMWDRPLQGAATQVFAVAVSLAAVALVRGVL